MKNNIVPKARRENLVVQELKGEVLIYDLDTNKAFCLNEASALVWQACDGNKDVSEIRRSLGNQLKSPVNDEFVWLALDQLKKENLLESEAEIAADFNGMSRRDVIKKVGLASVIALPIVTGLIAPPAVAAVSACASPGAGCTCTLGSSCNPAGGCPCSKSNGTISGCTTATSCNCSCTVAKNSSSCSSTCA